MLACTCTQDHYIHIFVWLAYGHDIFIPVTCVWLPNGTDIFSPVKRVWLAYGNDIFSSVTCLRIYQWNQCCAYFKSSPMHPWSGALLCRMCRRVLLVVLWLLIGTHLLLLAVELLSTVEPSFPSQCLFGTILVALYLMVWHRQVLRAEPMLSCWPNLFFFCLLLFSLFIPSICWLCGESVLTLSRPCTVDSILIIIIF